MSLMSEKYYSDYAVRVQLLAVLYSQHIPHAIRTQHDHKIKSIYRTFMGFVPPNKTIQQLASLPGWNWQGLPDFKFFRRWEIFANSYLVYVLIRHFLINTLEDDVLLPLGFRPLTFPFRCYIPGRFQVTTIKQMDEIFCNGAAIVHVCFRLFQYSHKKVMTLHYFLFLSRKDLNRYYNHFITGFARGNFLIRSQTAEKSPIENAIINSVFHDTLSYRVPIFGLKSSHYLRPNRCQEASDLLRKRFTDMFLLTSVYLVLFALVMTPVIIMRLTSEAHYEAYFSGCDVKLCWLHEDSFLHINWYRVAILLADILDNIVLWIESMPAAFYGLILILILHYDLIVYWQYLDAKVVKLYDMIRIKNELCIEDDISDSNRRSDDRKSSLTCNGFNLDLELREMFHELQFQLHDFFKQIRRSDSYISDGLSIVMVSWFSMYLVYVYVLIVGLTDPMGAPTSATTQEANRISLYNMMVVVCPMIYMFTLSWYLLGLHKRGMITYGRVCSILAIYQSDRKRSFLPVLDCFKDQQTCYTIFRTRPFLPTTYLSIGGWTFSFFFIMQTFR